MADKEKNNSGESFFQKFFSRLFKSSDPEAEKKRQLKNIAKDLSKCKYKFLKTNSNEVTGQLAKYFYDIYKAIAPAQAIIRNITNPNALKNAVILFVMEGKQQELYDKLSEEYILAQAEKVPFNELEEEIKRNLATLSSEFDSDKIAKINDIYIKMEAFKTFCNFDYFFLLKKFDSSLRESSFNSVPKFENIRGEYIIEDLKDFLDIVNTMPLEGNWQLVMKIFKEYRGVEPIAGRTWNTILSRLKEARNSRVFELMLKLLLQNPSYTQVSEREQSDFVEAYIERIKTQTNLALKKVEEQKKNNKVDELATALFGSPAVLRLRNYSESANAQFQKKMLAGYLYHQPLNYMKAFLTDYFKKDIREFADLVLIRGKWSTAVLAKELSDIYNAILSSSEQLNNFDESLGEDKDRGTKLKNLLIRSDKDGEANKIIKTQLRDINEAAFEILTSVSQNLVSFGRETKALLEDREKGKNAQMIINWNELDHFADTPIRELGVGIYKKIYQFVSLMQVFLKK